METPFVYDSFVTGKNFIGRQVDCNALSNLLAAGENVVIFEPPKSGKTSLVKQTIFNMRLEGRKFTVCQIDFHNIRSTQMMLTKFGNAVVKSLGSTPADYSDIVRRYLPNSHFVFDSQRFCYCNECVSMSWTPDEQDVLKMFSLPGAVARERGEQIYVIIEDFQSVENLDECDAVLRCFKEALKASAGRESSYIICGSRYNAMKHMFKDTPFFHGLVEHLPLSTIDDKEIVDHIVKNLNLTGKIIERDLAMGVGRLFEGNMWYINHFMSICDSITKGYVNSNIMTDALSMLISIHEPRFKAAVDSLTGHQVNFLLAVVDGVDKFTSSEIIRKYSLNSSANVARVKEALTRKEITTFGPKDEVTFLDPLFLYWLTRQYFGKSDK